MQPIYTSLYPIQKQLEQLTMVINQPLIDFSAQLQKSLEPYQYILNQTILNQISGLARLQEHLRATFSTIDWDNLNRIVQYNKSLSDDSINIVKTSVEADYVDPQLIRDIVKDVLEETGILSNQQRIEESVNTLITKYDDSNSITKQVIIEILKWFISVLLSFALLHQPSALWNMSVKETTQLVRTVQKQSKQILTEHQITSSMIKPYKFVSKEGLPIWSRRSSKSQVIHKCHFGDTAIVINKKRNWTRVVVFYDDNTTVNGWTYSRYLENPVRNQPGIR